MDNIVSKQLLHKQKACMIDIMHAFCLCAKLNLLKLKFFPAISSQR
jgi:hypothetical protein